MSRTRKLVVITAAWVTPVAWVAVALLSGPSDGTLISSPTAVPDADRWGDSATVLRTYGDTPLREGDTILAMSGRTVDGWVTIDAAGRELGDEVTYTVRRPAQELDRVIELEVSLARYPLADAVTGNLATMAVTAMLLASASLVFWHRPRAAAARSFLAAGTLVPTVLTSSPFGLGAIDLAGSRGVGPHLAGEAACALGLGFLLVSALTFLSTPELLRRHRWAFALPFVVPAAGYLVWVLLVAGRQESEAARLQALITVAVPALAATVPVFIGLLVRSYLRASTRDDRLSLRLVLLATGGGIAVRLLLVDLPRQLGGEAILPPDVVLLLLAPAVLGCFVVAMLRYRLDEVEPTVRRALVHALVATLVGTTFVAVVGAVILASGSSFRSMVAGGVVALLLLPVAVGLNRAVRRLVYGDRAFPQRVVHDLRSLDPVSAPTDALRATLALLVQRLRLTHASIEVYGTTPADRTATSIGEPRGGATTIDLVAGGAPVGRLLLEVDPSRDPFGHGDRRLLEDIGTQVGALAQAVSVNRDLQRSRHNLIAAREEERRRIRRDLHDGLGPSLATLAMRLDAARDLIPEDPAQAADLVGRLSDQARAEITEVRRLVDGLRPPALDQFGLVSALRQRADEHNLAAQAGRGDPRMTWTVTAPDDVEPLPAAVEVAAYRIAIEAVNNALRHSAATSCAVSLRREPDALHIEIRDTGVGLVTGTTSGIGLSSMRERAEELGGSCTVTSTPGAGTVIDARLPLAAPPPAQEPEEN